MMLLSTYFTKKHVFYVALFGELQKSEVQVSQKTKVFCFFSLKIALYSIPKSYKLKPKISEWDPLCYKQL